MCWLWVALGAVDFAVNFFGLWWLIFPVFGMVMAVLGFARDNAGVEATLRDARARLERNQ